MNNPDKSCKIVPRRTLRDINEAMCLNDLLTPNGLNFECGVFKHSGSTILVAESNRGMYEIDTWRCSLFQQAVSGYGWKLIFSYASNHPWTMNDGGEAADIRARISEVWLEADGHRWSLTDGGPVDITYAIYFEMFLSSWIGKETSHASEQGREGLNRMADRVIAEAREMICPIQRFNTGTMS